MTINGYNSLHYWVQRNLGRPNLCTVCHSTIESCYDWANISGEYKKELSDWTRKCRKCHLTKDLHKDYCKRGHSISGDNLYIRPQGYRECLTCKRDSLIRYNKARGKT